MIFLTSFILQRNRVQCSKIIKATFERKKKTQKREIEGFKCTKVKKVEDGNINIYKYINIKIQKYKEKG